MKKKLISYLIYATAVFGLLYLPACNSFVNDYEISPNEPRNVTPALILPSAQLHLNIVATGGLARAAAIFVQSQGGVDQQYIATNEYRVSESDIDNEWSLAYAGGMMDCKKLIDQSTAENKPYYAGMGKIMMAHFLGIVTDCWGDVPFSEALRLDDGILSPKYDRQEDVYKDIFRLLDDGIRDLSIPPGELPQVENNRPRGDDLFFNGDVNKWLITAHTLKARHYNRLSKRDPSGSAQSALAEIDKAKALGASNATDLLTPAGGTESESNMWYQFQINRPNYMAMGQFIVDTMNHSHDPRLPYYALGTEDGEYFGWPPGVVEDDYPDIDLLSIYTGCDEPSKRIPMVTFAELKFIESECHYRLGEKHLASEAYNLGMQASLAMASDDPQGVQEYLETYSRSAGTIQLEDIMFQKYIALFTQLEVWFDYRRTGLPNLIQPRGLNLSNFPRSMPTPISERVRNPNAPANFTVNKRVWWDMP